MQDNNDKIHENGVDGNDFGATREMPAVTPSHGEKPSFSENKNDSPPPDFSVQKEINNSETVNSGYIKNIENSDAFHTNDTSPDEVFVRSEDAASARGDKSSGYFGSTPDCFSQDDFEKCDASQKLTSETDNSASAESFSGKDSCETRFDADATQFIETVAPASAEDFTSQAAAGGISNDIKNSPSKRRRIWIPVLSSSLVIILACMAVLSSYILSIIQQNGMASGIAEIITPMMGSVEPPQYTNVLLVGTDKEGYRTDTIMVATYDNETESVHVIQIPRDTYVAGNGRRDKKVNSAYFSGIDNLKDEIFLALGLEVHKYVSVELKGFVEMVDAIGGVEFDVPINMDYDDPEQNLHIHLKKGLQTLDGKKAEGLVRYRKSNDGTSYPLGDLDRMKVQREFIMKLIEKIVSIDGLSKIPELLEIAQSNVQTDIPYSEAYGYITKLLSIDKANIKFFDTPGEAEYKYGGWYYFVDNAETKDIVSQYFYGNKNKKTHVIASVPANSSNRTAPPMSSNKDIADDERYTYYTATEKPKTSQGPSVSPSPSPSAGNISSEKPSQSQKPVSSESPLVSAAPSEKPSSTPPAADESAKPSSTPQIIIKPSAAPQSEYSE